MAANTWKHRLRPGRAYRRSDLAVHSASVDRELKQLVREGFLKKERTGLYSRPGTSKFGEVPVSSMDLIEAYLKTKDFVIVDHSALTGLGLGLTQLYNELTVYNQKRHGLVELGGMKFRFKRRPGYPLKSTPEFLLVEYLNERKHLAEEPSDLNARLAKVVSKLDKNLLRKQVERFGKVGVKKELSNLVASA